MSDKKTVPSRASLVEMYIDSVMTPAQIGKQLECGPTLVRGWLDTYGIQKRSRSESRKLYFQKHRPHNFLQLPGENLLRNLYFDECLSVSQIAKKYGVSPSTVQEWFKRSGIKFRSKTENAYLRLEKYPDVYRNNLEKMHAVSASSTKRNQKCAESAIKWCRDDNYRTAKKVLQNARSLRPPKAFIECVCNGCGRRFEREFKRINGRPTYCTIQCFNSQPKSKRVSFSR